MGILAEAMKQIVRQQRLGYIATVCPDETPNLSPKGTTTVWDDDHLIFADICSPGTIENLSRNPAIEINVVDPFVRKGFRFKGKATVLREGSLFEEILAFYQRSGVKNPIRSIVLVKVERASPLISPGYSRGVTEDEMRAQFQRYYLSLNRGQADSPTADRDPELGGR
jgi:predicted pyridoxine 5'-phosphate oxidase superfamily flavin-nucleotide-binding protein